MNLCRIVLGVSILLLLSACGGDDNFGLDAVVDTDYYDGADPAKVSLGKKLFFDKILSGNQNISCATCHHPNHFSGDGLSLGVGEGGSGLGPNRTLGAAANAIVERVPRNSPALFNLGATQFVTLFHDGRVEIDSGLANGFENPADDDLPSGLENLLAVQAMFPVTSPTEMAGQGNENSQATQASLGNLPGVWEVIAIKVRAIGAYATEIKNVFGLTNTADISYVHIANALAAYEIATYRSDNSPFDQYLRGESDALTGDALVGANIFYGGGLCSQCHSGVFQTDHKYYNIGMPQFGPGKGDGASTLEDYGRERVTEDYRDRYKFRTPSLRNVALTGPWGHNGAYNSLEAMIRHHLDPSTGFSNYDSSQVVMKSRADLDAEDFELLSDSEHKEDVLSTAVVTQVELTDQQITQLVAFLNALTDPGVADGSFTSPPSSVPSGLPVAD